MAVERIKTDENQNGWRKPKGQTDKTLESYVVW